MSEKEFKELNNQYINCLNNNYDFFFEGNKVDLNNETCKEILDKMKKFNFYKELEKEFADYQKTNKTNS
jgi:hypothetical protein